MSRTAFISLCVVEPGLNIHSFCCRPKLSLPFLPAGVGRARGRRVCGMSVDPRAICHVRLAFVFITSKAKLKKKKKENSQERNPLRSRASEPDEPEPLSEPLSSKCLVCTPSSLARPSPTPPPSSFSMSSAALSHTTRLLPSAAAHLRTRRTGLRAWSPPSTLLPSPPSPSRHLRQSRGQLSRRLLIKRILYRRSLSRSRD